ncbi:MAG: lipoprotein insertase outer membrane protein LolB, partial [Pseudomonadota bacterium]
FFLFALLLLSGCAALPARAPDEVARAWAMRQQALAPITNWELRGRIALRSRDEGMQASLHWVRERERQRISLVGPLGSGQVRLTQDAGGAELRDTEKNVRRAPTARQLLVETTGWDVPFDDMNWWVRGLPAPGAKAEQELDEDGRLKTLTQFGWEVEFLEYGRYGAYELPSKLFARRRENAPGIGLNHVTTEVRVVIERWVLPGE